MNDFFLRMEIVIDLFLDNKWIKSGFFMCFVYLLINPCFSAVEGDMQEAVKGLQKDIFGSGWVTVGKIAAAATGIVMSIARMSPVPFVLGGLTSGGIHFFQKYTESAASCLIMSHS